MSLYRDTGIVLRTYKLGEADRIVVLLTAEHGKVRAVAKGVRKTKSRFGGRLEPTVARGLLLYEGRELDVVNQAETLDHFRGRARGPRPPHPRRSRCSRSSTRSAQEREPERPAVPDAARRRSGRWPRDDSPLRRAAPSTGRCWPPRGCSPSSTPASAAARPSRWSPSTSTEGGVLCRSCRRGVAVSARGHRAVAADARRRSWSAVLAEPVVAGHPRGRARWPRAAMEHHLERRLRSVGPARPRADAGRNRLCERSHRHISASSTLGALPQSNCRYVRYRLRSATASRWPGCAGAPTDRLPCGCRAMSWVGTVLAGLGDRVRHQQLGRLARAARGRSVSVAPTRGGRR